MIMTYYVLVAFGFLTMNSGPYPTGHQSTPQMLVELFDDAAICEIGRMDYLTLGTVNAMINQTNVMPVVSDCVKVVLPTPGIQQ